ncbi:MAG: flagellar biosynthesis anti-sigma factor FlgM [Proteobacteria bacterium]|nr:flagellar biosynthesis anti-sigma factor FlgM [Pseudomonadota bacterium]
MRIDKDVKVSSFNAAAKSAQTKSPKETAAGENQNVVMSDKIELSSKNIDIAKLVAKINAAPSIRQDKVSSIKEAIQNGTYNVKGDLVAKAVLKKTLMDEIL